MNTKRMADDIVNGLRKDLQKVVLPAFRTIYIAGSYCRGDWLDCSSDLDIHAVYNDIPRSMQEQAAKELQNMAEVWKAGRTFFSHCPGGIDFGYSDVQNLPQTYDEACMPSRYAPFSTTMFDLKKHHITLYGEELNDLLPPSPEPAACAKRWFVFLMKQLETMTSHDHRMAFTAYKAITAAQLHYGEPSLNKYRMLEMYQKYIPDFETKYFGEWIIRNYVGSFYPDRPPLVFSKDAYMRFLQQLSEIMA